MFYLISLFQANAPFLYLLKPKKTRGFPVFSGGIETEHWLEIDRFEYSISELILGRG